MCRCAERKAELSARGYAPLFTSRYTPVDSAQWLAVKVKDALYRLR